MGLAEVKVGACHVGGEREGGRLSARLVQPAGQWSIQDKSTVKARG